MTTRVFSKEGFGRGFSMIIPVLLMPCLLGYLLGHTLFAQGLAMDKVYDVPLASCGNTIELTIQDVAQPSLLPDGKNHGSSPRADVKVRAVNVPEWIFLEGGGKQNSTTVGREVRFQFSVDKKAPVGATGDIRFVATDAHGKEWTKVISIRTLAPERYELEQNYPNPFNPQTTIGYLLPSASEVSIRIYNLLGEEVQTLVSERQEAGYHSIPFDGSRLASGMYVYRIQASAYSQVRKMMLMK